MPSPWDTLLVGGSDEQKKNIWLAQAVARREGVPESVLLGVLWHESGKSFKTDPGGNGGGMAQALETTAQELGYSQEQLRKNPGLAAEFAAKYLKQNAKLFNNDWDKAAAAYFLGPGTIQAAESGPGNWLDNADALSKKYNQGSATDYLTSVGLRGGPGASESLRNKTKDQILQENGLTPKKPTQTNRGDPDQLPNPDDFWITGNNGERFFDEEAYAQAIENVANRMKIKQAQRETDQEPLTQYIDDVIKQIGMEISSGQLELSKANSLFTARTNSYKDALAAFEGDAFKFAAPGGSEFLPGHEPGGFWETRGVKPVRANRDITLDPLQMAMQNVQGLESALGNIRTPQLPNIADLRNQGMPGSHYPPPANLLTHAPEIPGANNVNLPESGGSNAISLAKKLLQNSIGGF